MPETLDRGHHSGAAGAPSAGITAGRDLDSGTPASQAPGITLVPEQFRPPVPRPALTDRRPRASWALLDGAAKLPLTLASALVLAVALAVRLPGANRAYDIFIDEATYASIARSVASGEGISLHGEPFVLHPPITFWIMGLGALGNQQLDPIPLIMALRPVCMVFGALVVALVFATGCLAGHARAATLAAALLAIDPFGLRFDSRLMMESIVQAFAAATVLFLVLAARSPARAGRWALAAGLAGALTFGAKETFGLVVVAMLGLLLLMPSVLPRRAAATALAGTLVGYGLVNLYVVQRVGWDTWLSSRLEGLGRLTGAHQPTGFKAEGSRHSFWDRVLVRLVDFGPTYLLLGLGLLGAAAVILAVLSHRRRQLGRHRDARSQRLRWMSSPASGVIAAWTAAACGYLAYAVLLGSLEEQMFYIALAPCALSAAMTLLRWRSTGSRARTVAVSVLIALTLGCQAGVYGYTRTHPADGYLRLSEWIGVNVPAGSKISVTEDTAQFLLRGQVLGEWHDLAALRRERVDFVLVSPQLVGLGFGTARPPFLDELREQATVVYQRRYGQDQELVLFDVRPLTGGTTR